MKIMKSPLTESAIAPLQHQRLTHSLAPLPDGSGLIA